MSQTQVGVNSPQAVKRWATSLAVETDKLTYWNKFVGAGENNIIERKTELEEDAGDEIRFDLSMKLRGGVVTGDNVVEGTEENLTFYQDAVRIDQVRKGVSAGGRMTRKRTLHNLRKIALDRGSQYMAEWTDDMLFTYISGDSALAAVNQDNKFSAAFAGNAIQAPDSDHILYGGVATSKATLTANDKVNVALIERVSVRPTMMNATNPDVVQMQAVNVEGGKRFVFLMSPFSAFDMRTETGDLSWSKIQQALATSEGRNSPICKGGLGMINDVVLHQHSNVRRFSDYGAGGNVRAARNLLLGRQAGVIAYGAAGNGTRMQWTEKKFDADNQVAVYYGGILGAKKTRYNNRDFGVIAVDTAARDPNAA